MNRALLSALFMAALVGALFVPHDALACSTGQPGVHVSEYVEHVTSVPPDGVLAFRAILIDVAPEDAPDYFKITVRSADGDPVPGALDVEVLGPNPDERPLERQQTAVGDGRVVVLFWKPTQQFSAEQAYDASVQVTQPSASFDFSFTTQAAPMGALLEPTLSGLELTATERTGGNHKCCRVAPDSCARETSCWFEDFVYYPTIDGQLEQVALPAEQVLYRIKRVDQDVATAYWFTGSNNSSSISVEFLPETPEPFCVTAQAELLSDGSTVEGTEHCFDSDQMQPFEPRSDTKPAPQDCVSDPFDDNNFDDQPDGDGGGDAGIDAGADTTGADTDGSETSSTGQDSGCGCRTLTSPLGSAHTISVWMLVLVGLAFRRRSVSSPS